MGVLLDGGGGCCGREGRVDVDSDLEAKMRGRNGYPQFRIRKA